MEHNINLNIHYSAPQEVWQKIGDVYESMQYWTKSEDTSRWIGEVLAFK